MQLRQFGTFDNGTCNCTFLLREWCAAVTAAGRAVAQRDWHFCWDFMCMGLGSAGRQQKFYFITVSIQFKCIYLLQ